MKKQILTGMGIMAMIISLTACGTQTAPQTAPQTTEPPTEAATQDTSVSQPETDTSKNIAEEAQENQEGADYADMTDTTIHAESIVLTEEWDKVFPLSDEVNHRKVTFVNHFGNTLAADLYEPKNYEGKLPAIAVCGPFGAVKEQSSGLYAQEMAKRGFLAIAFDPSFTGESGGYPRYFNSPDINVEDYQAAIDFLSVQDNVDPGQIGMIGICG